MGWLLSLADLLPNKGDILVRTASGLTRLAVGSDDQVLTADSSATAGISWGAGGGGGGGGRSLIDSDTLASSGAIEVTSITGTHTDLVMVILGRSTASTQGDGLLLRVGNGSFDSGASDYAWTGEEVGQFDNEEHDDNDSGIFENSNPFGAPFAGDSATSGVFGLAIIRFFLYADTTSYRHIQVEGSRATGNTRRFEGWGIWKNTSDAIDQIQADTLQGDFTSGTKWWLYGID